nr:hypothetical protein [candidate division Zixibacteria bacterium]
MSNRSKLPAILLALTAFCLAGTLAFGETMDIINGHVGFMVAGNGAYLPGSTDDPDEEITHNRVMIQFESGWPPQAGAQVTSIILTLTYDEEVWTFYDAVKTDNWPGTLDFDTTGDGYIQLIFSGQGINPPYSYWTTGKLAEIQLEPKCQEEFPGYAVYHALTYHPNGPNYAVVSYVDNSIIYNDIYYPDPMYDAFLFVQPYIQSYSVQNTEAILGDVVQVPILAETDFRLFSTFHVIDYDETRLEYIDVIPNPEIFEYTMTHSHWGLNASDNLEVYLTHDSPAWPLDWIGELEEGTVLYWIEFRVLGDDDDIDIPVNFVHAECEDTAWTEWRLTGGECEALQTSINPPTSYNGFVQVAEFTGEMYSCGDQEFIDKSGGIQPITFNMKMKHNFPVGNYTGDPDIGEISAVFELPAYLTFVPPVDELNDSLDFHSETYANGATYLHVYQEYNSQLTGKNFWPPRTDATDAVAMDFYFNEANFTPNYNNRYIYLPFVATGHDWYTRIEDTTGYALASVSNGQLTAIAEGIEVHMGEFHSNFASSSSRYVSQDIYLRANFDIGHFSVDISVNNSFTITNAVPYLGARAETIDSNTRRIYYGADSAYCEASGNDFVKIATLTFRAPCTAGKITAEDNGGYEDEQEYGGGGGSYTQTANTVFENVLIEDYLENDHFVYLTPSNVRGTCGFVPLDPIIEKDMIAGLPTEFRLNQNHPNPFNPTTTIAYDIPASAHVRIDIVNILGQKVATVVDEVKSAGSYQVVWNGMADNGARVSSGIYLCFMQAGDYVETRKMMLMK